MTFAGGRHHLNFGNCNAAAAVVTVSKCVFSFSASASIKVLHPLTLRGPRTRSGPANKMHSRSEIPSQTGML